MKKRTLIILLPVIIFLIGTFSSCDEETNQNLEYFFGWMFEQEDPSTIPDDINLATAYGNTTLPTSYDLTNYFPAIGNQGQYGTCVAWACGYYLRTYMYARIMGYTAANLNDDSRIFSPKDLFWAIPNSKKSANCNGTTFQAALDVMIDRGVATMSVVPYTNLGNCSSSPLSNWTSNANNYKILNYRQIEQTIENIKRYIYQGKPIVFGAKLGDEFMNARGDFVLTSQTYGYTGQHSNHAMIVVGYDDDKGPNGAFKVLNSWGTDWGNNGIIWVDYNFFVQSDKFAFACFIANNIEQEPDLNDPVSGYDLQAWNLIDEAADANYPRMRRATYNVYNTGENELLASADWNILYLYYNAYNANDYGIILYDIYTDDYGSYGYFDRPNPLPDVPAQDYWANYVNIPAQSSVANIVSQVVFGTNSENFVWTYETPPITGYYYLVLIADGFDVFKEYNEDNNYYYFTHPNGDPIYFVNGVMQNPPVSKKSLITKPFPKKGEASEFSTVKNTKYPNAYSTKEITMMLKAHRESGDLNRKVLQWQNANKKVRKEIAN